MTTGRAKTDTVNVNFRLKDVDKDYLFRKIKEIQEHDIVHYRRTCSFFTYPKKMSGIRHDSSDSDDSANVPLPRLDEPKVYEPGSFGFIRVRRKKKLFAMKRLRKHFKCKRKFEDIESAIILSDTGHLNKFELSHKDKAYVFQPALGDSRT